MTGWVKDLPDLNTARFSHGCGHYYDENNDLNFLVTGGFDNTITDRWGAFASTETLNVDAGGSWKYVGPLPTARHSLKGITINNQLYMTGGFYASAIADILKYDILNHKWIKTGNMYSGRRSHSLTLLPLKDIKPYCKP